MEKTILETSNPRIKPEEVERVEIISLIDNSVDFLSSTKRKEVEGVKRWAKRYINLPFAEHGFSILVRIFNKEKSSCILFDVGSSPKGVVINAKRMGVDLAKIECVVLSHGHYDHFGGLKAIVKAINKVNLPIIVHEDMFKPRGIANPDGTIRKYPAFPVEEDVRPAKYVQTKQPHLISEGMALVTGEIPRKTDFEKGYFRHRIFHNHTWHPDPWLWDDRALVINLKRKGLVILSGCAHAGIINTILYAQQITGINKIYAILGGLHLAGKENEQRIIQTVKTLKSINPVLIAPSHCTGWQAASTLSKALPSAFIWNSVGNLYRL
ncbi:MAG: MBL fold metallo-hydrolase [Nitrososphaeria archaeon]